MKILSIDTSTMLGGVAIVEDDVLIAEARINIKIDHSERLLLEVNHLVSQSRININDIDVFAIAIGPGSFTGLRVGLSTVKGLVYATGKKVVSVSTLEAFAWNMPFCQYQICPLLDARRKELYAALFRWQDNNFLKIMEEQTTTIDELLKNIDSKTIFIGEGAILYKEKIEKLLGDYALFGHTQYMQLLPSNIAYLGLKKAKAGDFDDIVTLTPKYYRKSEAEIRYNGVNNINPSDGN